MRRPAHIYAPLGMLALLTLGACSVPPRPAGTTGTVSPSSPVPIGAVIDDTPSATVPAVAAASPQEASGNPYPFGPYPAPGEPIPTPFVLPTSTPDLQVPLMTDLGQRQEAAGVAVTVLSMERTPIAQPAAPYPGPAGQPHDQITLELLVENVARPTLSFYAGTAPPEGSGSVRLLDTNGQTYQPAPFTPHHRYQRQGSDLLKGDRLRHTLVYAVPPNTHDLRLRFDPRAHNPGTYPIEVNLERTAANVSQVPAAAPLPPGSPLIGAPQQIGAFAVTVLNVERRAHVPEPFPSPATPTTPAYTDDILVDVLFENTSLEEQDYSLLSNGYLKDQDGYEYVDPLNGFGRLGGGERARVRFVFTVHQQADGFRLGMLTPTFTPAPISSPSAIGSSSAISSPVASSSPSANTSPVANSSPTTGPSVIFFDLQQRSPTAQSPTPSGPVGVLLGERQEANGIGFTVEYVTRTPRIETMTSTPAPRGDQSSAPADASTPRVEPITAAPGNTFVFVYMLLENTGQQAQPALPERFMLTDDAGRTYRSIERGITAQPPFLVADPLLANDFERGGMAFEIPQAAHGVRLSFEPPPTDGTAEPAPALHVDLERRPRTFTPPADVALTPDVVRGDVGKRVEVDGIALTVALVEDKDLDSGSMAGTHRITVEVVLENVARDQVEYGPLSFRLRDEDGHQHLPQPGGGSATNTTLKRGAQARFPLSFEAWKGRDLSFTYYDSIGTPQPSSMMPIWIAMQ